MGRRSPGGGPAGPEPDLPPPLHLPPFLMYIGFLIKRLTARVLGSRLSWRVQDSEAWPPWPSGHLSIGTMSDAGVNLASSSTQVAIYMTYTLYYPNTTERAWANMIYYDAGPLPLTSGRVSNTATLSRRLSGFIAGTERHLGPDFRYPICPGAGRVHVSPEKSAGPECALADSYSVPRPAMCLGS